MTIDSPVASAAPTEFTADGSVVVPAGATAVAIEAYGAQGVDSFVGCVGLSLLAGQAGGSAVATVDLTPGDVLNVHVGGRGGDGGIACNAPGPGRPLGRSRFRSSSR